MATAYVDSSVIIAVAFGEQGRFEAENRIAQIDDLRSSNLLEAEVRAAFYRTGRPFKPHILHGIRWIMPARSLADKMAQVLEAGYVRGADLWHLACALYMSEDPSEVAFITLDEQQAEVARSLGFRGQG